IRKDLKTEHQSLIKKGKHVEANRLLRRVNYDLEMIREVGYVNGIENYSRYFDGRKPGDAPYSLIDYFKNSYNDDFTVFVDESHMTIPQIRGMYNGDFARKRTLIDFGFRLNAAYDNRPLKFEEFENSVKYTVYVSATPNEWEVQKSNNRVVEQLIRPTGILDPKITIKKSSSEIESVLDEVKKRVTKKQRVLITTLTKKTAEDLSEYFKEKNIKSTYLHSDIDTLERSDILDNLRNNMFDVLIGVNLLREGLDLPEVTLVAILDADKEGFLRSKTALIQTMGRAARNIDGEVIIYADTITKSISEAVSEIERRRQIQANYNKSNNITPKTIYKPIREKIIEKDEYLTLYDLPSKGFDDNYLKSIKPASLTGYDRKKIVKKLESEMKRQAESLNFEYAIKIRDKVLELKKI
ncbi:MAG: helicase-related protein, partial [Patescibacteria group bacterium]